MHTEDTALAGTHTPSSQGLRRSPPIVPLARARQPPARRADGRADRARRHRRGRDERSLSVHYELDPVTHRWVASILDDNSGEVVRTVPSTQVLHQLAALAPPVARPARMTVRRRSQVKQRRAARRYLTGCPRTGHGPVSPRSRKTVCDCRLPGLPPQRRRDRRPRAARRDAVRRSAALLAPRASPRTRQASARRPRSPSAA